MENKKEITKKSTTEAKAPDIFNYRDFRLYLLDFYNYKKATSNFSFRKFARMISISTPNFMKRVVMGERNLTEIQANRVADICNFKRKERLYFIGLVKLNQARTPQEREIFNQELQRWAGQDPWHELVCDEFKLLNHWSTVAVLEMIKLKGFQGTPELITELSKNRISAEEATQALNTLKELGLVVTNMRGRLVQTQPIRFTAGIDHVELIEKYHQQLASLANRVVRETPVAQREFNSSCVALTYEQFKLIKKRLRELQEEVLDMTSKTMPADVICQLNLQLFPVANSKARKFE